MTGLLFALVAVLAAGLGARDQVLVARLAPRPAVALVGIACAVATGLAAGWAGIRIAPLLAPGARTMLVALALAIAAFELFLVKPGRRPLEPTQSLGALGIVLVAEQLFDAARLLVFAIASASQLGPAAAAGGALGGAGSVALGWLAGERLEALPLALLRRMLGAVLMMAAGWLAYNR